MAYIASLAIWLNFYFTALYSGVSLPFNGAAILCLFLLFFIRVHLHNLLSGVYTINQSSKMWLRDGYHRQRELL